MDGLLLGWSQSYVHQPRIGYIQPPFPEPQSPEPIFFNEEGHLLTIGPTGAGKGVGCIIPACLSYSGPIICIDPKGEACQVTARHRKRMGQQVIRLDPFGVITDDTDALNPFDLLRLPGLEIEDEARAVTELLTGGQVSLKDPFWDNTANAFLSGLISYLGTSVDEGDKRLSKMRQMFGDEDLAYAIAKLLDEKKVHSEDARQEFCIFLQHPSKETRPGIQSTASQHLRLFGSRAVRRATDVSTFDLQDVIDGEPMTIYIIIPPTKLESHRSLLRLWLGTLLMALTMRRTQPAERTLFIVDEAAQLGHLAALRQTVTLYRGYGVQAWLFFQDASQLRSLYPDSWPAIVNNCSVVQMFGAKNQRMAQEFASLVGGVRARSIMQMPATHQMMLVNGKPMFCQRPNYLKDDMFHGRYDANPMYRSPRIAEQILTESVR